MRSRPGAAALVGGAACASANAGVAASANSNDMAKARVFIGQRPTAENFPMLGLWDAWPHGQRSWPARTPPEAANPATRP
ncbi:hypothetical protein G6F32_014983 [Rhizopus arrhizus]|nr:hypothetical protein G6F32_014983 [Rhizopus arrhizus]